MTEHDKLSRIVRELDTLTYTEQAKKQNRRGSRDPLKAIVDRKAQDARQEAAKRLRETF